MKSASSFKDLEQFGIKCLTGEADALGFRILCDLDEQGVRVFKECFGIPQSPSQYTPGWIGLAKNWNSGSVASVLLTGYDVIPLAAIGFYLQGKTVVITDLAAFALDVKEDLVLDESGDFYNIVDYDEKALYGKRSWLKTVYGEVRRILRQRKNDDHVQGTRNVHQMSGRVS
jgi:hypothetical protein